MSVHLPTSSDRQYPPANGGLQGPALSIRSSLIGDPRRCPYLAGTSRAAEVLRAAVQRLAHSNVDILLQGEPGSGKHAIARALAFKAGSTGAPVDVHILNGKSPEELQASAAGNGGPASSAVLYVGHVDTLTPERQAELARWARNRPAPRMQIVASIESNPTDDTARQIDPVLEHILGAVRLCVPPLRHRKEDISPIAETWLRHRAACDGEAPAIDKAAIAALRRWPWPGNVTELLMILDLAIDPGVRRITADRMRPLVPKPDKATVTAQIAPLAQIELSYIRTAVERCGNNRTRAAALLGIGRSTLIRKLKLL